MSTQFFVDVNGAFLGGFGDGAVPPEGAIEVMEAPPSGYAYWRDGSWYLHPEPVPESITFAQLLIGLVAEKWISEAEGTAWLRGTLPSGVTDLIATLPAEQRFAATARAIAPSVVMRADPLVNMLASAIGKADHLDNFFRTYAVI